MFTHRNVCRSEISVKHASNRINVAIMPALVHIATKTKRVPVNQQTLCWSKLLSATKPSSCAKIEKVRLDFGFPLLYTYIIYIQYTYISTVGFSSIVHSLYTYCFGCVHCGVIGIGIFILFYSLAIFNMRNANFIFISKIVFFI